ncbi:hypothetical protein J1N35_044345 [Gossypium stocksii]|uniref:DUF4283 domain-containing protein n=1 Tax=Gossypium stocksii TaxID=47602 RepID=A0A9D3U8V7_9ROSI|nr:hypothetical protein J1N35_044345 [Gossypium stocksii]
MEEGLANLNLFDEEEEAFHEEDSAVDWSYQFCLMGRCLTDSVVHLLSLRSIMADLWHPIRGICISDIGDKRILFHFFHEVDVKRVLSGTPWFFNNHLLILHEIQWGEDLAVDCNETSKLERLWVGETMDCGLSLGWKWNSLIRLKKYSSYHIDVELGHNQMIPWLVVGDFNEIMNSFEKKGGRLRSECQMSDFHDVLDDCGLDDLGFVSDDKRSLGLVEKRVTNSMNDELIKPFTEEDITRVVKSMTSLKALVRFFGWNDELFGFSYRLDCSHYEVLRERVNFDKSLIYFGANVELSVWELVTGILGVRVATNPEKYLGLPMMIGRKKRWPFAHFIDRFRKKTDEWGSRYLPVGVNRAADTLALEGRQRMLPCFWDHEPLESVRMVMTADWTEGQRS